MKVRYFVYRDVALDLAGLSDAEVSELLRGRPGRRDRIRRNCYSFVSLCWHPRRRRLYVGATNGAGDILLEFAPASGRFRSCGYARSGLCSPHELKIHKGLWLDARADALCFGTATLSPMLEIMGSEGGALVRYDLRRRRFRLLARPTPGDYYQATCWDPRRGMAYMFTIRGCFAAYDLRAGRLVRYEPMQSCPHNGCLDDDGGVWGTHSPGAQAFYRYLPDQDRFEFPRDCRFPEAPEAANVMYPGAGPVDALLNGGDGCLYAGSALGGLYRLFPRAGRLEYLGKPFPGKRLSGLALGGDGRLYMCGGSDREPMLGRYDRRAERFELLGRIQAPDGKVCFRAHDLAVVGNTVYVGETDNPRRSGYLWACRL
jgi:hypothetical protein